MRFLVRQGGIALVELVIFIMTVGIGVAGILLVMNTAAKGSADPLLRKQALAIAEAMLEEVQSMPFTFCDPDEARAIDADSGADCPASTDQNRSGGALSGPTPAAETRHHAAAPFDNVADYAGYAMNGGAIFDLAGAAGIPGLGAYKVQPIDIRRVAFGGIPANGSALLITVTVTDPGGRNISVQGIRTRYAPRDVP